MSKDTIRLPNYRVVRKELSKAKVYNSNNGDTRQQLKSLAEKIIKDHIDPLGFVKTMGFAYSLCEVYDVNQNFPAGPRIKQLYSADDWREAAQAGLYHIILAALDQEIQRNGPVFAEPETVYTVIEFDTQEAIRLAEDIQTAVAAAEPSSATRPPAVSEVLKSSYLTKVTVANHLTEEYSFQTWKMMTDTDIRDAFGYEDYCNCCEAVIRDFSALKQLEVSS